MPGGPGRYAMPTVAEQVEHEKLHEYQRIRRALEHIQDLI
jgi:hypothetical protein